MILAAPLFAGLLTPPGPFENDPLQSFDNLLREHPAARSRSRDNMYATRDRRSLGTGSVLRTSHRFSEASRLVPEDAEVRRYDAEAVEVTPVARPHALRRGCAWIMMAARAVLTALLSLAMKWQLLLACSGLFLMTSIERVTFKLSVDRLAEFRCFAAQLLVFMYLIICGVTVAYKFCFTNDISRGMYNFPQWQLASIAMLDTIQLFLYFASGATVSPPQTVLLLQLQVPLVALLAGAKECCAFVSQYQVLGSIGICVSVVLAVLGSAQLLGSGRPEEERGVSQFSCVLLYVAAAVPAAGSTVLKERAMVAFGKPMEPALMNSMLAAYQLLFAALLSPLAFRLQALLTPEASLDWSLVQETADNGLLCVLIGENPVTDDDESYRTRCPGGVFILFAHALAVLSLPAIATAVLSTGKIRHIYGVVVAATGISVVILALTLGDHTGILGTSLRPLELCALMVLVPSLLVYHVDPEHGIEIITQHESMAPSQ